MSALIEVIPECVDVCGRARLLVGRAPGGGVLPVLKLERARPTPPNMTSSACTTSSERPRLTCICMSLSYALMCGCSVVCALASSRSGTPSGEERGERERELACHSVSNLPTLLTVKSVRE